MNREEKALELHHKGYNCAQSVACSFADITDINEKTLFKLMEGFGLGMGDTYGTCGAISGAIAILGLLKSEGSLNGPYTKADTYKLARKIDAAFRDKNKATVCRALKGLDTKVMLRSCDGCVEDAVIILEKLLKEIENKKAE